MDTQQKYSLSGAIIIVSCFLLLAGACDNSDRIEMDTQTEAENVLLNFNASTTNTVTPETRAMENGTVDNFNKAFHYFGLSVTKNGNPTIPGSDNMTATMTKQADGWSWEFKDGANSPVTPQGPTGKPLKIKAYYCDDLIGNGQITGDAFTNGIPFDFTQTDGLRQYELLYNINTLCTIPSSGADKATIPLRFQHAYSWISIRVTKYANKGTYGLTGVSIENLSGGKWIKNKGTIDPETGLAMEGAEAGPIGETKVSESLPPTSSDPDIRPITYDFLVPSFMDNTVEDQHIAIVLVINGKREVFPLERAHLNQLGDKYGFRQGYYNKYKLEFNNSSLNLRLLDWTSRPIDAEFGGSVSAGVGYETIDYKEYSIHPQLGVIPASWPLVNSQPFPKKPAVLTDSDGHPYDSYLTTVAYGGNGVYVPASLETVSRPEGGIIIEDDQNVATMEPICDKFQITKNNVSDVAVPWVDENGVLVAKELCKNYNGDKKKDWRLPRASELRALFVYLMRNPTVGSLQYLNFKQGGDLNKLYWTGTEVNENEAWAMLYYNEGGLRNGPKISPRNKSSRFYVRCIRDVKE